MQSIYSLENTWQFQQDLRFTSVSSGNQRVCARIFAKNSGFCAYDLLLSAKNLLISPNLYLQLIHVPLIGCGLYKPSTMSCSLMRWPLTRGPSSGGVSKICKRIRPETETNIDRLNWQFVVSLIRMNSPSGRLHWNGSSYNPSHINQLRK